MDPLPPIPTPFSMHWREFRIRFLPVVGFCGLILAIAALWRNSGITSYVAGVAEGVRSTISSPQVGVLHQLNVRPYQLVHAGDPIAIILPQDPRVEMDLLQSQLQIARLRLEPSVAERNAMNFEGVRVDLLRTKAELAIAQVNFERSENDVRRNEPLFKERLVSEEIYDLSLKSRDMFRAEILAKSNLVVQIEARLGALDSIGVPQLPTTNDVTHQILARLDGLLNAVSTNWGPIVLRAPINGMVAIIHRQAGENVVEGEPLLSINGDWAERIVAFVRQPYLVDPLVGMPVHVTTREHKAKQFWSEITQVGTQVEMITNALAFVRMGYLIDVGLPLVIDVPKGMQIRPGETVDVVFRAKPLGDGLLTPILQPATGATGALPTLPTATFNAAAHGRPAKSSLE